MSLAKEAAKKPQGAKVRILKGAIVGGLAGSAAGLHTKSYALPGAVVGASAGGVWARSRPYRQIRRAYKVQHKAHKLQQKAQKTLQQSERKLSKAQSGFFRI